MAMAEVFGISSFTSCSNISFKVFGSSGLRASLKTKIKNLDFQRNQEHPQNSIYQIIQQNKNLQAQGLYQHPQLLQNQQQYGEDITEYAKSRKRRGMKGSGGGGGGEIVQVQGGHIVRSTGRKDRHSKVYTSKGPRDRRVRLSAHTAIQFYDVQDRLGYDRPSKAVDWLIKKAKSAIDKLAELPPWHPTANETNMEADHNAAGSSELGIGEQSESSGYSFQLHRQLGDNPSSDFIDPGAIPNTMKSLFPTSSTTSSVNFQSYPAEIISRTTNQNEDLGLSLHSFQNQGLNTSHTHSNDENIFAVSAPVGYEANFQRMMTWNSNTSTENRAAGGGFAFNPPPLAPPQAALLSQDSAFSQRGPLQSSFAQSVQAWNDLTVASADHHRTQENYQSFIFGSRFAPQGLPGFSIPAQIHGEEEQSPVSDGPSSSSPHSQH